MITTVATLRTAMLDALANPGSFLLQVGFMVANDATWLIFWTLFFNRVGQLRGWTRDDLFVLFAVTTTVVGIALGLLSNCRWIGQLAADGALDETLMLPVAPLPHLLASRIDVAALG
ncbi:MAG: ABC-2 family transporter protein, partial [Candidatus Dormibacteraceae bacterium]